MNHEKTALMILVSTMTIGSLTAFAGDLPFPKTEAEIIQALNKKKSLAENTP
jgi:hypothetical protein